MLEELQGEEEGCGSYSKDGGSTLQQET